MLVNEYELRIPPNLNDKGASLPIPPALIASLIVSFITPEKSGPQFFRSGSFKLLFKPNSRFLVYGAHADRI